MLVDAALVHPLAARRFAHASCLLTWAATNLTARPVPGILQNRVSTTFCSADERCDLQELACFREQEHLCTQHVSGRKRHPQTHFSPRHVPRALPQGRSLPTQPLRHGQHASAGAGKAQRCVGRAADQENVPQPAQKPGYPWWRTAETARRERRIYLAAVSCRPPEADAVLATGAPAQVRASSS